MQSEERIEDTIFETKRISSESGCENTTKRWERQCPRCNRLLSYSNKYKLQRANDNNSKCLKCCKAIVLDSEFYYRKCQSCDCDIAYTNKYAYYLAERKGVRCKKCSSIGKNVGTHPSLDARRKMSLSHIGSKHTEEHKRSITGKGNPMYGVHRYDEQNPFYGKRHTDESKRKMRIAMCKQVLELQRASNGRINHIGKKEGAYFAQLEKEMGWNGIYYGKSKKQFLVEHLGYFVDYYEPTLNIVVEYDEPRHYRHGVLREKDVKRMNEIKAYLGCRFWRYDEYRKCFQKV